MATPLTVGLHIVQCVAVYRFGYFLLKKQTFVTIPLSLLCRFISVPMGGIALRFDCNIKIFKRFFSVTVMLDEN